MKSWIKIFTIIVAVLLLVYWLAGNRIYEFAILKIVAVKTKPVPPNHAVVWEKGPETAAVPAHERPPNVILILADDLGYNDLTDNGGAGYIGLPDINKPYRGWKATFFEGGLHAPFFMKWPQGLPQGATYDQPVAHFDIFATVAGAAGIPLPADRDMDGADLMPYIKGEQQGSPHKVLFWESGHYRSVLAGGWKLQTAERPKQDWLFNLDQDPTEQVNLARQKPQKVAELKSLLAEHEKEKVRPIWPSLIEGLFGIDHPTNIPLGKGDEYVYWPN